MSGNAAPETVCDEVAGDASPERIEQIESLADAERYLRADGWSRSRSKAFVARIRSLRDEQSTLDAIAVLLRRRESR